MWDAALVGCGLWREVWSRHVKLPEHACGACEACYLNILQHWSVLNGFLKVLSKRKRERERGWAKERDRKKRQHKAKHSSVRHIATPRKHATFRPPPHTHTERHTRARLSVCSLSGESMDIMEMLVVQVQATAPGCCWCVVPPWTLYGLWNVQVFNRFFQSLN